MNTYKKFAALALSGVLALGLLAGCSTNEEAPESSGNTEPAGVTETTGGNETTGNEETTGGETLDSAITVISREEGSGTRGAFVELMGVETDEGDMTTVDAEILNSTSLVQSTVAGNVNAIGYISLGSYDSSAVKAVMVDGVEATVDNIKAGSYAVSRPFVVCYKEENLSELGQDFVNFIMSADGQAILTEEGYISTDDNAAAYTPAGLSGSLSINGSTSVGPVMEVLAEAYMGLNSGVTIDIQQTGSGTGITSAIDGSCELGMSSRAITDEEQAEGLTPVTIAMDGIAVIVNLETPITYVMPVICLAFYPSCYIAKLTRTSMLDSISQDYIRTARAKGVKTKVILFKHALRNSLIPVITYLGPLTAGIITGSLVVEQIFNVPGVGNYFVSSILNRDYPVIMGTTILLGCLIIIMNLVVDIAYKIVDPRINITKKGN